MVSDDSGIDETAKIQLLRTERSHDQLLEDIESVNIRIGSLRKGEK